MSERELGDIDLRFLFNIAFCNDAATALPWAFLGPPRWVMRFEQVDELEALGYIKKDVTKRSGYRLLAKAEIPMLAFTHYYLPHEEKHRHRIEELQSQI